MDLVFCAGSQDQSAAARFAGCLRQGGSAPHSSICFVHKDAGSRRFVVSFLGFFSRARVTTIVTSLQQMEGSKLRSHARACRRNILDVIPSEVRDLLFPLLKPYRTGSPESQAIASRAAARRRINSCHSEESLALPSLFIAFG